MMAIFEQIIAALPQEVVFKLKLILATLLVLFLVAIYVTGYFSSSRRYEFYRDTQGVGYSVTRFFLGLLPIHKKRYRGLKRLEVEDYLYEDEGVKRDCAELYAVLSSGDRLLLKKLTLYGYEHDVKQIAHDIESIIHARKINTMVIHHCRKLSFVMGLLAFVLSLPWLLLCLWWLGVVLVKDLTPIISESLAEATILEDNNPYVHPANPEFTISDLPNQFPIIDDTFITKVERSNQDNDDVVWLKTNSYNGIELTNAIKIKLQAQGWETSNISTFPSYDIEGNLKAVSGYDFYFRRSPSGAQGHVATNKSQGSWGAVISIPADLKASE